MANIVIATNTKAMGKLDGSVKRKVYDFLEKLQTDDTAPSLHIEPIKGAADARVRTGRVDLNYRAILFRLDPEGGDTTYVYMGTWKHDEANDLAEQSTLRVNKINGTVEGIIGEINSGEDRKKVSAIPNATAEVRATVDRDKPPYLVGAGFTMSDLVDRLGLDPVLAERAMAAADDYAINEIAADIDGWQGDALLDLACGTAIDDIREKYSFTDGAVDESLDEDSQILAALEHPASRMQFTYIDDTEELRRVIEGGDFAAWRTFLHPEQRTYVEKDFNGAFRLSGGAGTGKTVVAIHRARRLWKSNPQARIILTTFNKTLAKGLEADLKVLDPDVIIAKRPGDPGIYVAGIDKLASDIANRASDLTAATTAVFGAPVDVTPKRTTPDRVWREIAQPGGSGLDQRLSTPAFLENEYVSVVLANKVTTLEQYVRVARAGRGVRLSRAQRIAVWKLVEAFRRHSRTDSSLSFPEILAVAAEHLTLGQQAGKPFVADHVLVDEAQDLHATHWALLHALVPEGSNDLFIAEDSHQRIYGQPVVLGRMGIKIVGRSRRLTLNYRTTAQNLNFAVGVLSGADYHDLEEGEESTLGYRSARLGPNPDRHQCNSLADELDYVAETVRKWLAEGAEPETIAVLTRGQNDRTQFVRALGERGIDARALDDNPATTGHVQVLTMHRSKGMEFSRVVLAGVDEAHVPSQAAMRTVPEEEKAEAELCERSLLYVAASRARDELVVTWSGKPSTLLGNG
ncbi:3'-5' exonuclease [Nocardia jiangxiensis]|uniref:3'-5' exonuclease n=1 Tax=Nocardia jiangxiensis TaxID=282685 RepID=UPI0002E60E21|nr:3'-5' exonuclease [Nocardia jiangxiensis]